MSPVTTKPARRGPASRAGRGVRAPRRTTITLSPESREIVERFRSANGVSTSSAVDEIILRSEPKPSRLQSVNGFLVLDPEGARPRVPMAVEDVKRAEDAMDREYVARLAPGMGKKSRR
jgi:hypothetical protein